MSDIEKWQATRKDNDAWTMHLHLDHCSSGTLKDARKPNTSPNLLLVFLNNDKSTTFGEIEQPDYNVLEHWSSKLTKDIFGRTLKDSFTIFKCALQQ